jgi:hypothetical protein
MTQTWLAVTIFVEFILLWYIILKFTYVQPSATTDFISFVTTCYLFQSYWSSSGISIHYFKTLSLYIYIYIYIYEMSQIVQVSSFKLPITLKQ